jgi:hypothetical protein|tara:strand:- start:277 stop:495 length:219 start_codon:yes stop_codon:yes gene_type:complete
MGHYGLSCPERSILMASTIKEAYANAEQHKQNTEEVLDLIEEGAAKISLGKGDYVTVSISPSGRVKFNIVDK